MEWASQLPPPAVGEVRKPLREPNPAARQPPGAGVEHRVDLRGELRVLDRGAAVALDEREHDVLAAQPGQQLVAGDVAERRRRRPRRRTPAGRAGRARPGGPGRRTSAAALPDGDRHARGDLRAEQGAGRPRRRRAPRRAVAAVRCRGHRAGAAAGPPAS